MSKELKRAEDELRDEKVKVEKLNTLVDKMPETFLNDKEKLRLIELTKENTLLEVNLNKLTRKY